MGFIILYMDWSIPHPRVHLSKKKKKIIKYIFLCKINEKTEPYIWYNAYARGTKM